MPPERAEEARAVMIELFPEGFEEIDGPDGLELAAYTDPSGEERIWQAFGGAAADEVPADWLDRWRRFHHGVRVGALWVGPPWEEPPADTLAVVIDPGRAFGTGGHPTTRLCLELLGDLGPGSLVDVGCGSGVLGIAALKLGFGPVTGLDHDPQAVEVAAENAEANGVRLDARLADALDATLPETDVAVANITLEAVDRLGPLLRSAHVVTSGYLASEQPRLDGYRIVERRELQGWAADLYAREGR